MTSNSDGRYDLAWGGVDLDKAQEILALGQAHLQAQLETALAADARATAMASLYVTLSLAALAGGLAYWQSANSTPALWAGLASGGLLLIAAVLAARAAQPINFYLPGTPPGTWLSHINDPLVELIGGQAEIDHEDIRKNDRVLDQGAKLVKRAFRVSIAAPIAGTAAWLICAYCSRF